MNECRCIYEADVVCIVARKAVASPPPPPPPVPTTLAARDRLPATIRMRGWTRWARKRRSRRERETPSARHASSLSFSSLSLSSSPHVPTRRSRLLVDQAVDRQASCAGIGVGGRRDSGCPPPPGAVRARAPPPASCPANLAGLGRAHAPHCKQEVASCRGRDDAVTRGWPGPARAALGGGGRPRRRRRRVLALVQPRQPLSDAQPSRGRGGGARTMGRAESGARGRPRRAAQAPASTCYMADETGQHCTARMSHSSGARTDQLKKKPTPPLSPLLHPQHLLPLPHRPPDARGREHARRGGQAGRRRGLRDGARRRRLGGAPPR